MTARRVIAAAALLIGATAQADPRGSGSQVVLLAPFISGSTVYSARQLSSAYSAQIGARLTAESLASIVASIELRYRQDGFVAPVVTIEEGTGLSGTPRLVVHEAEVTGVQLMGDAGPNQEALLSHIHSLVSLRPIHKDRAREILTAIQRLPGVGVRASFQPTLAGINEFTLVMEVGYHPVSMIVSAGNRGTRASGRELVSGRVVLNGLLGQREFITLDGATSSAFDQYHDAGLGLTRAFGRNWVSLSVSNAHARPWAAGDLYDRDRYSVQLLRPAWESESARLTSTLRFVATDATLQNDDFGPLSREHLRKIEAGLALTAGADAEASARLSLTLVQGISGWGARAVSYDDVAPADPVFTKLMVSGARGLALAHGMRLTGRFVGEYAFDALPGSEQFTYGGARFGRGLEAADLAGRSGAAVSVDLEHPSPWRTLGLNSATLYTGIDYGYAWSTNAGYARDHAASSSVGMLLEHAGFNSSVELAYPLHRPHFSETNEGAALFLEFEWML